MGESTEDCEDLAVASASHARVSRQRRGILMLRLALRQGSGAGSEIANIWDFGR
jgi:hypothetical protein